MARYNASIATAALNGYSPNSVHDGSWTVVAARRQALLDTHHLAHPGRYRRPPQVPIPPGIVWINKPHLDAA